MHEALERRASLELGLVGNCAASALVDEVGSIVWCCLPRFDGDPIFHALLHGGPEVPVARWGSMLPSRTHGSNHIRFVGPTRPSASPPTRRSPTSTATGGSRCTGR